MLDKFRINYKVVAVCFLAVLFSGCRNKINGSNTTVDKRKPEKINDLIYSTDNDEYIVYFKEDNEYQPYLVLSGDYGENVLAVRQYLLLNEERINDYSSYYENSEIDQYLNRKFLERFSKNMKRHIQKTAIPILDKNSVGTADTKTVMIDRKVFLLSFSEIGYKPNGHVGMEGKALVYFKNASNRIAVNENGNRSSWWLRSADSNYRSCVYAVGASGEIGSTNAFSTNGVRPALCLDKGTNIELKKVNGGKSVYVIAGEKDGNLIKSA